MVIAEADSSNGSPVLRGRYSGTVVLTTQSAGTRQDAKGLGNCPMLRRETGPRIAPAGVSFSMNRTPTRGTKAPLRHTNYFERGDDSWFEDGRQFWRWRD